MKTVYSDAIMKMNKYFQEHSLDEFKLSSSQSTVNQVLLQAHYLQKINKKYRINPRYAIIPKNCVKYAILEYKELQYNKKLWKDYQLRHIFNNTDKIFIFTLIICYCLYIGISRPQILYNTMADNIFFGFIFPIFLSFVVSVMYHHEIYNDKSHNSKKNEYSMYFKAQVRQLKKNYSISKEMNKD